jgi:type II secretory pathway pseudopilin PulG
VELMIVIVIVGILAAALFPSINQYVIRAKDASKISHIKILSNAIEARYIDK